MIIVTSLSVGPQNHADPLRLGVAHDVGQRLLQHTVQGRFDVRGQAFVMQRKMQVERDGGAFTPGLQQVLDCSLNGEIVQGGGPDFQAIG